MNSPQTARLLYECASNWLCATGISISDPAIWYQCPKGKTHIYLNALEINHAQHATVDKVHYVGDIFTKLAPKDTPHTMVEMLKAVALQDMPDVVEVPFTFPAGLFQALCEAGVPLRTVPEPFFTARVIKDKKAIEALRTTQHINQKAFMRAKAILSESDIAPDNILHWQGHVLTAEIMQAEMNKTLLDNGCLAFSGGPIVGCAAQGADPHERGHGPLKAHELIVIDCFPQGANHYWGDLTRTFLKGTAQEWQLKQYKAVKGAQDLALSMLKPGINGRDVQNAVATYFNDMGYETGRDDKGRSYGFFHGVGHSVGLELHDVGTRTLSAADVELKPGMVTSVEPGLYYPGKGGVRLEDVVTITENGYDNLTTIERELVIA